MVSILNRPILPLLLGFALAVNSATFCPAVWAEEAASSGCSRFLIHVRMVKAERKPDKDSAGSKLVSQHAAEDSVELSSVAMGGVAAAPKPLSGQILIDKRLRDIAPKLNKLPYRTFTLVATDNRVVALRRRDTFNLPNGHTLTLRPLYLDDGKVGLWIKWLDQAEVSILDTRMHFDLNETVLAGTDSTPASGLILAVDVKPAD